MLQATGTGSIPFISATRLPEPSVDLARAARRSDDVPAEWDDAMVARAIVRYRKFLQLVADNPRLAIAPTKDIDVIWHLHMLSPRAYHDDCIRLFGQVLDHDGGFGREAVEEPLLAACFERTSARWQARFGEAYVAKADDPRVTNCWHDCSGRCWHDCKSVEAGQ